MTTIWRMCWMPPPAISFRCYWKRKYFFWGRSRLPRRSPIYPRSRHDFITPRPAALHLEGAATLLWMDFKSKQWKIPRGDRNLFGCSLDRPWPAISVVVWIRPLIDLVNLISGSSLAGAPSHKDGQRAGRGRPSSGVDGTITNLKLF